MNIYIFTNKIKIHCFERDLITKKHFLKSLVLYLFLSIIRGKESAIISKVNAMSWHLKWPFREDSLVQVNTNGVIHLYLRVEHAFHQTMSTQ